MSSIPAPLYETYAGLAQQFFVPDETGVFLTSIDLFFQNKDPFVPVTIQIRTMVGGVPSNVVLPFSEVTLDPSDVKISADAKEPTKFTFPSPVYLSGPLQQEVRQSPIASNQTQQYAIVVLSNSNNYKLFIAKQGETSLETNTQISQDIGRTGSLFKTQNASTWVPSIIESLKYTLYRANFNQEGLVRFFNTPLSVGNNGLNICGKNQFLSIDKKISVGIGTTIATSSEIKPGITIKQGSVASGKVVSFGSSITNNSNLNVVNVGAGYTDGVFANVELVSTTGYGQGARATIQVSAGTIETATVTSGGLGYASGDLLTISSMGQNIGFGALFSVVSISNPNSINLEKVQGNFSVGITTLTYINSSNVETSLGVGATITSITNDSYYTGDYLKVLHYNHGMNLQENFVEIRNFRPLNTEVNSRLSADFSSGSLSLESTNGFETFEGLAVSGSNLGYAIIGNEIISYSGITNSQLTGVTRSIDYIAGDSNGCFPPMVILPTYSTGTYVYKYELNGISLRRINKTHNFADVDIDTHPIEIDSYHIKIDTSTAGKDRSSDGLYFNENEYTGEAGTYISQNIQYNSLTPNIRNTIPSSTTLSTRVRTISGTSIDGNEDSFEDTGFVDFPLDKTVNFTSPRIVASRINELNFDFDTPGNRSLELDYYMKTTDSRVSPVLDIDDCYVLLTSNRVNSPIKDYSSDERIRSLDNDPHEFVYISKAVELKIPANSIKVLLTADLNINNDVRVLYRIFRKDVKSINYEPFPGYSNYRVDQDGIKRVIDPSKNDGSADSPYVLDSVSKTYDLEFSVDDLPDFEAFSIKIIGSSTNQALSPSLRLVRAIATKRPSLWK